MNKPNTATQQLHRPDTLQGVFRIDNTYSDIQFHYSDSIELTTELVDAELDPGVTIGVLIRGRLEFFLGEKKFELTVTEGESPVCFAFNLSKKTNWQRQLIEGNYVTKTVVTLPKERLEWLPSQNSPLGGTAKRFISTHAQLFKTQASIRLTQLLNQFVSAEKKQKSSIELESTSLQFFIEGLKNMQNAIAYTEAKKEERAPFSNLAIRIKLFLEENLNSKKPIDSPSLSVIAYKLGSSVSTIQRQFLRAYGSTIAEHIRIRKLQIAHEKLEEGINIGEVAYQSGYHHTSNFSSAFKKHYGKSPGEVANSFDNSG